ncbi:MAG: exopolyphosphatase [Hyphomicrobiales bacterium]|nr:MAG: exopolyphosphatase [Hyphomicrobiales bacterium]
MNNLYHESYTPSRLKQAAPVAVVDIGSNSVRMVVYEGPHRAPSPFFNEKALCALGDGVADTGKLGKQNMKQAIAALKRFRLIANQIGVGRAYVIATAAARDASNGAKFVAKAREAFGVPVDVLSGEREAQMAGQGVLSGIPEALGLVGDMGGGSLELIGAAKGELTKGVTYPLGSLRLMVEAKGSIERAEEIAHQYLRDEPLMAANRGLPFYAVGGSWRMLARIHMLHHDYPLHVLHYYTIPAEDVLDLTRLVKSSKTSALLSIPGVSTARVKTLPFAAAVLERVITLTEAEDVVISASGVREGVLYGELDEDKRLQDPLLSACHDLAVLRSRSPRHAQELCNWTDQLFVSGMAPSETDDEKRLRHAACLLADIGWRAHPDYRGEQSLNVIANGAFIGLNHQGRAFLALTVFYRYEGLIGEVLSPRLRLLADWRELQRARMLGAALRLAYMISASMPNVIDKTRLVYENNTLVLVLPRALEDLRGDKLEKRLAVLANLVDRDSEIRIEA